MRYVWALTLVFLLAAHAHAETLEEYLEKIEAARESVAGIKENPSRSDEAVRQLSELEDIRVTTPDGETFNVVNRWAGDMARELQADSSNSAARSAQSKLEAIQNQAEGLRDGKSAALDAKLSHAEEFEEGAAKPVVKDVDLGIRERMREFAKLFQRKKKAEQTERDSSELGRESGFFSISPGTFTIVVVILIGVIIIVIAYQIAKSRTARPPGAPAVSSLRNATILEDALKRTPQEWKELASEYFEKGDYTQALRALYLSLLVVLHRRRLISYDSAKTNWEYVWEFSPARPEYKPFQALTSAFDYKWYGRETCSQAEYLSLERQADSAVRQEVKKE